jgi:hypothetical protein
MLPVALNARQADSKIAQCLTLSAPVRSSPASQSEFAYVGTPTPADALRPAQMPRVCDGQRLQYILF